jgi:alkylation response protein AidB-like acyl-CoA dehydrogenase
MLETQTPGQDPARAALQQSLVERAKRLAPGIAARAEQAERDRRIPDETIAEVAEAGLFATMVPRRYGGHELGVRALVDIMRELSPLCVSSGWTIAFYMAHNWMWCLLPEEAQHEIFNGNSYCLGPVMVAPTVRARPENGGFRITGAAKWATGAAHASWCMVSGIVEDAEDCTAPSGPGPKPPDVRLFAMPWRDVKMIETWRTSGMAATASHDVVFEDIWVPGHRVMNVTPARSGQAEGARVHASPIYNTAFTPLLCISALAPLVAGALGAASHAVARARAFQSTYSGRTSADNPAAQIRLAKADLAAKAASTLIDTLAADIERDSLCPPVPIESRARQRAQASYIATLCRDTVTALAHGAGASGHMLESPIQRAYRDISMAACHVVFDQDPTMELHGKMILGMPPAVMLA